MNILINNVTKSQVSVFLPKQNWVVSLRGWLLIPSNPGIIFVICFVRLCCRQSATVKSSGSGQPKEQYGKVGWPRLLLLILSVVLFIGRPICLLSLIKLTLKQLL